MPLCPPQTPHAARTRTRAAAVGSQRLIACGTARPILVCCRRSVRNVIGWIEKWREESKDELVIISRWRNYGTIIMGLEKMW
jgi:hypothetical protein